MLEFVDGKERMYLLQKSVMPLLNSTLFMMPMCMESLSQVMFVTNKVFFISRTSVYSLILTVIPLYLQ